MSVLCFSRAFWIGDLIRKQILINVRFIEAQTVAEIDSIRRHIKWFSYFLRFTGKRRK